MLLAVLPYDEATYGPVVDPTSCPDGEAGPLLCHGLDAMTSRGQQGARTARAREAAHGGGREVPKYLPPRWPAECQVRYCRVSGEAPQSVR